jgi:hypothetical protein
MDEPVFAPGFRISTRDKIVVAAGVLLTLASAPFSTLAALIAASAVGHFFLFCNVFRIPRVPELLWAAAFVAAIVAHEKGVLSLAAAIALYETWAAVLIIASMRRKDYHGVGWQRLNPDLRAWWDSRR